MKNALFQGEGGARHGPLEVLVVGVLLLLGRGIVPRDEGLVKLGDVKHMALELAFLEVGIIGKDTDPVAVAQAVDRCLGLGVPRIDVILVPGRGLVELDGGVIAIWRGGKDDGGLLEGVVLGVDRGMLCDGVV